MVLLGTFINAVLIIVGSLIGKLFKGISENMKQTIMYAIGIAVIVMGIQMGLKSENFTMVIICLVVGGGLGEWIDLEKRLNHLGHLIEKKFSSGKQNGSLAQGFVTGTLIFVIGAMGILGAINSGIQNDHDLLISKGIIDGFTAMILSATLGIGVVLSAVPVFIYQGIIALLAIQITMLVPTATFDLFIQEMTATGGIMIIAIGLNLIGLTKIRVANLLPSLLALAVCVWLITMF